MKNKLTLEQEQLLNDILLVNNVEFSKRNEVLETAIKITNFKKIDFITDASIREAVQYVKGNENPESYFDEKAAILEVFNNSCIGSSQTVRILNLKLNNDLYKKAKSFNTEILKLQRLWVTINEETAKDLIKTGYRFFNFSLSALQKLLIAVKDVCYKYDCSQSEAVLKILKSHI